MSDQAHERFFIEQVLRVLCQPDGASRDELSQKDGMTGAFVHFMDEMPGGFLIYRASQGEEIIYANRSLLRIFQCETMEEFRAHTGNSFRGLVHPDDLKAVEESIRSQVEASQHDFD